MILASGHALFALHKNNLFQSDPALQLELCIAQNLPMSSGQELSRRRATEARAAMIVQAIRTSRNTANMIDEFAKEAAVKLDRDALFFYCPWRRLRRVGDSVQSRGNWGWS
jgi:hypothetical protein